MSEAAVNLVTENMPIEDISWDNIEDIAPKPAPESAPKEGDITPEVENKESTKINENVSDSKKEIEPETTKKSEDSAQINDDLELEVKVDGKLEKISLKDLKSNYSGKVAYDKKFSEIDKDRKSVVKEKTQLELEIKQINGYVNTFAEKMKAKDSLGAMAYLAEFSGISPAQMKQNLITQLLPEINRLSDLSPEARELEVNKEEVQFQKSRQEMELKKLQAENSRKESELANMKLRSQKGVSESEWDEAFEFLDTHLDPSKPITREDVVDYALWKRADSKAMSALSEFDGGKYREDRSVRDTLIKIANENPDFSDKDLKELLMETFKGKVQEEVKKVAETKNVQDKPRDDKGRFSYTPQALTSWD